MMLIASVMLWSCADDTSQIDELMAAQEATLEEQLQILNNQGEFYNFNLKILDGNDPIEGATVALSSSKSGEVEEISSTSDANGNVFFTNFKVGGNYISISKENYYTVNGIINFKFEEGYNYEIVNGNVVPIERNETAILPLYAADGSGKNTSKIAGKVTMQSDLTTEEPEFAVGEIIKADFTKEGIDVSDGLKISEYTVSLNDIELGSGVVDSAGNYTIIIPGNTATSNVELVIPEIKRQQRLAFYNSETESYEYTNLESYFGINQEYNGIPNIRGIIATTTSPPAGGEGLEILLSKVGRAIDLNRYSYDQYVYPTTSRESNNITYRFFAGYKYQGNPQLKITDENGGNFRADIHMEFALEKIDMTNAGKYHPNQYVEIAVDRMKDGVRYNVFYFVVYADNSGEISQEVMDDRIDDYMRDNYIAGFGNNFRRITEDFDSLVVRFGESQFSGGFPANGKLGYNAKIERLDIRNRGESYVDPSFEFIGGNPSQAAIMDVSYFGCRWAIELINASVSSPYQIVPEIDFLYSNDNFYNLSSNKITLDSTVYDFYDDESIEKVLKIVDGKVDFDFNLKYYTGFVSDQMPDVDIENISSEPAAVTFALNEEGGIDFVDGYFSGRGYSEPFEVTISPTIEGLPGENANIKIRGGRYNAYGEYIWQGEVEIIDSGSGYIEKLNPVVLSNFAVTGDVSFKVVAGQTIYRDINYGSGRRIYE
ncbi:hypothetical protein SAMN05661096_00457 [Marivirga sericea]|uniref:Uncharacterized protein n=2 Tax=Marivirga sericea TaxID=1028 RepID=A0A1X7IB94_9BACT|nr:hypothetical protein SAMN05661096_00457 [Marivirga sericea]